MNREKSYQITVRYNLYYNDSRTNLYVLHQNERIVFRLAKTEEYESISRFFCLVFLIVKQAVIDTNYEVIPSYG